MNKIAKFLEEYVDCRIQAGDDGSLQPEELVQILRAPEAEIKDMLDVLATKGKLDKHTRAWDYTQDTWWPLEKLQEILAYEIEDNPDDNPLTRAAEEYGYRYLYFPITDNKVIAVASLTEIYKIAKRAIDIMEG